jgi:hypothetical protein
VLSPLARRLATTVAAVAIVLSFPAVATARITGGCMGEGHSTSAGANLTTDTEWHLHSDDVAGGSATAPSPMKNATVAAYALGIGLPIAGGASEDGETAGSVDGVNVSTYAILGRRFVVAGSASGEGGAECRGDIEIILDDVEPLFTILGGGGIILALIGLIAVLLFTRSSGGWMNRVLSAILGGLGGAGGALAAEQFDLIDPTEPIGLFIVIGAAIVGFLTAGMFGPRGAVPPVQ